MPELVVFDLDGTLVDSREDLAASANALLEELGAPCLSVDAVGSMVGDGARILVGRVLEAARLQTDHDLALARFLDIYDQHLVDHTRLYPGVADALDALAPLATLAVLTNKPLHHTERLLAALGVRHHFLHVVGGDGPWPRKPDPTGLRHLMQVTRSAPETTIMVGDSMVDVETARRASAHMLAVGYGFGRFDADAIEHRLVIDRPESLAVRLVTAVQSLRNGISLH